MKLKRTVSVILAFFMIVGMMPLTVLSASEEYEQIYLGEIKSANILNADDKAFFKFIPEEDGYYSFISYGNRGTRGYIYDRNMQQLVFPGYGQNFEVSCKMSAGVEYILAAKFSSFNTKGSFNVSVSKATLATEISISASHDGYVGDSSYLLLSVTPKGSVCGNVEWSSSDENVAKIVNSLGDTAVILYESVGTTTVTAESETGLKAACEITVSKREFLYEDNPCKVEINEKNEPKTFYFSPETTGEYTFYCDNYSSYGTANISLYVSEETYITSQSLYLTHTLKKGYTYKIITNYSYDQLKNESYDLTVTKATEPTAIEPLENKIETYIHAFGTAGVESNPWYAVPNKLKWTSGDESVISITESYNAVWQQVHYMCRFKAISLGTTTLTATDENGLTAQCTVTVKDYESISSGETKKAVINSGNLPVCFKFTPAENGYYVFYSEDNACTYGRILDENMSELASDNRWNRQNNFKVKYKMQADTTYIIETGYCDNTKTGSFNVSVSKAALATEISIPSTFDGYIGDSGTLNVGYTPNDGVCGEIKWTSSNEAVVTVAAGGTSVYPCGHLTFLSAGAAVITAESETGLKATCKVTVSTPLTLYENMPCKVTVNDNNDRVALDFTPPESGDYIFYCDNYAHSSNSAYITLYDSKNIFIKSESCCLAASLKGGERYRIYSNYSSYSMGQTERYYDITAIKAVSASGVELLDESKIQVYVNTVKSVSFKTDPWYAAPKNLTWTSGDESVVSIIGSYPGVNQQKYYICLFKAKAPGTTTLTATDENGLTAQYTVTVRDYEKISAGETKRVVIDSEDSPAYFKFTPAEDGYYAFYSEDNACTYGRILDESLNELASDNRWNWQDNFKVKYKMQAGTAYIIETGYCSDQKTGEFNIISEKMPQAKSISIIGGKFEGYRNTTLRLNANISPENAAPESLTWSSGNESIATVDNSGLVSMISPGVATIKVTAENGLTAECTVTVKDYVIIKSGEKKRVATDSYNSKIYFSFTPEEDGWYTFYSDSYKYVSGSISDENLNQLASDNTRSYNRNFKIKYKMTAGKTYILSAGFNEYNENSVSFDVTVEKARYITKLEIINPPDNLTYVKGFVDNYLDYSGLALKATRSDGTTAVGEYMPYYDFKIEDETVNIDTSTVNDDGIVKFTCGEAEIQLKLNLTDNPVVKLEVVNEIEIIENTGGYYTTDNSNERFFSYNIPTDEAVIKVIYRNGTSKDVKINKELDRYRFSCNNEQYTRHWKVGSDNYFTVTYLGHSVSVPVTVKPSPVESIEVVYGTSRKFIEDCNGYTENHYNRVTGEYEYFFKYYFSVNDISDAVIKINYANGDSKTARIGDKINGYRLEINDDQYTNHWKIGNNNYVTVSYMDKETRLPITVVENPVDHIEVVSVPSRSIYYYGDQAFGDYESAYNYYYFNTTDPTGLTVRVYYKNGTSKQFTVKSSSGDTKFDGYSYSIKRTWGTGNGRYPDDVGKYKVEFSYMGKSAYYNVELKESPVESVSVTRLPTKTDYNSAFAPVFDGMKITIKYKNGTCKSVTFTPENTNRYFTFVDESVRCDYMLVDGYKLMIRQSDYNENRCNEFYVSYLGAETVIKDAFSYTYNSIEDITVTKFNRYTSELTLLVKYKSGETEVLNLQIAQIDYYSHILYTATPNGIIYYYITPYDTYRVDACDIEIFGKTVHIPAKENLYDINCDGDADAQDLVLMRAALLNSFNVGDNPEYDINRDGNINILDLIRLKKYISGAIKAGDVNGDGKINAQDLVLTKIAMLNSATVKQNYALDVNNDGIVNILDLIRLKKYIANGTPLESSVKTASAANKNQII